MICSVDDCVVPQKHVGLCGRHYQRMQKYGTPTPIGVEERQRGGECLIDGCSRRSKAKGFCAPHYQRFRKHGDPLSTHDSVDVLTMIDRVCLVCGIGVEHRRSNAAYCSAACKALAADRRRNARPGSVARKHSRRHRLLGNRDHIPVTRGEWLRILRRHGHRCAYCGAPAAQMDHVIPLARGGRHAPANILPACASCNASKNDSYLSEWRYRAVRR